VRVDQPDRTRLLLVRAQSSADERDRFMWEPGPSAPFEQVVSCGDEVGMHLHPLAATVTGLAQPARGFHPAEAFLDPFAHPLTERVVGMPSGPRIECGPSGPRQVLRYVRSDLARATGGNELASVVGLVARQRDTAPVGQLLIRHGERRPSLRKPVRRLDLKFHQQEVAVLGHALPE